MNKLADIKVRPIAYKGGGAAMTALISGEVLCTLNNGITLMPRIKSGKVRPLAVSGNERNPTLPHVPTFAEMGVPGYNARNWMGVALPPRTPRLIVDTLAHEVARIRDLPEIRERIMAQGVQPFPMNQQEFRAFIQSELIAYKKIIKDANIILQQIAFRRPSSA